MKEWNKPFIREHKESQNAEIGNKYAENENNLLFTVADVFFRVLLNPLVIDFSKQGGGVHCQSINRNGLNVWCILLYMLS